MAKKETKTEAAAEATEAKPKADETKANAAERLKADTKRKVPTAKEDAPRKREAFLKSCYGDVTGARRFAEEQKAGKELYPR